MAIRVGIVDDHAVIRRGLRALLALHEDLEVVGEGADGQDALDLVRDPGVDVLLMDISMPGPNGLDVITRLKTHDAGVGILVYSGHPEAQYAMNLIRQGASGYLNKDCDPNEIVDAIRNLAHGRRHITPVVAQLLAAQVRRKRDKSSLPHEALSVREFQVFTKLAAGKTPRTVAKELSLSPKTVSTYRSKIIQKLQVSTNSELTYYAVKLGLLD